jgi:cytoskeletal protein CcmA (bactofilin family)
VFSSPNSAQSNLPKPPGAHSGPQSLSPARAEIPSSNSNSSAATGTSVIGSDLTILGDKITIISQNKLQVDGHVRGDVHGKQVLISKDGSVTGKVWAEKIEVRGGVRGSIVAIAITLFDSAQVEGDIMHQKLSISEGAEFDGRVRLIKDASELMPILDAEAIASRAEKSNGEASSYGAPYEHESLS